MVAFCLAPRTSPLRMSRNDDPHLSADLSAHPALRTYWSYCSDEIVMDMASDPTNAYKRIRVQTKQKAFRQLITRRSGVQIPPPPPTNDLTRADP